MKIYPVVHANNIEQTVEQAGLAFEAEADGVFLIDHSLNSKLFLPKAYNAVREHHPDEFVGLNFLQAPDALSAYAITETLRRRGIIEKRPSGLWVDDAAGRVREDSADPEVSDDVEYWNELWDDHTILKDEELDRLRILKDERRFSWNMRRIKLFGGTAFKYTAHYTDDPELAAGQARQIKPFVDVVTTTGAGTGSAPDAGKIRAMKEASGRKELAIASGVSMLNIEQYRGIADSILVASSVEVVPYSGIFDETRLRSLIHIAHSL